MANALAAIAIVPSGATIIVDIIWAPHITTLSHPIGRAIPSAFLMQADVGLKLPLSCVSLRSGDFRHKALMSISAVTTVASAVPMAAPVTPSPAPGTMIPVPWISSEGNISRKLKMTSRMHIMMFSTVGVYMFPLLRSIPLARTFS